MKTAKRYFNILLDLLFDAAPVIVLAFMAATAHAQPSVAVVVDSSITSASLSARAVCALHTDAGCFNAVTDATAANCTGGTLTAACTFPISLTIPAGSIGTSMSDLVLSMGGLSTATIPNTLIEIYLDSIRVYAGTATPGVTGSHIANFACSIIALNNTATSPVIVSCANSGVVNPATASLGPNALLSNTTPGIAIDTTVSHVLKVSCSFSANTTGNLAWLNGIRFDR